MEVRCLRSVLLTRMAPSPFNNGKRGVGCEGDFLRVRDEKTSEPEGKRESEYMGSWWQ